MSLQEGVNFFRLPDPTFTIEIQKLKSISKAGKTKILIQGQISLGGYSEDFDAIVGMETSGSFRRVYLQKLLSKPSTGIVYEILYRYFSTLSG